VRSSSRSSARSQSSAGAAIQSARWRARWEDREPSLGADALEELARGLHVLVLRAPVLREVPAEGRREDRLTQRLEQRRHGVERLARATASGLEGFELGDDAPLLVGRSGRHEK